jgi:osmotically-inducible protein OsmY
MIKDAVLQKEVQDALRWEPILKNEAIAVTVVNGITTLSGTVNSYVKKQEAETVARNVLGVKALVEKIDIQLNVSQQPSDTDIAHEIINAFEWTMEFPSDHLKVLVENGWVTLEGELVWHDERENAVKTATRFKGVKGVTNNITIRKNTDAVEKAAIEGALARSGYVDDKNIEVKVNTNNVTLLGQVSSYREREEAERIAWKAPGVDSVNNLLRFEDWL